MTASTVSKWLALAALSIVADVANLFLAPFAVLFARDDGWLPRWLWWLQTPDNSLDGDFGWRTQHLLPLKPRGDRFDALRRYLKRVAWLYRNPMYAFDIDVLGARCQAGDVLQVTGDVQTGNRPGHSGAVWRVLLRNGVPIFWQFYYVRQWGNTGYCVRVNLGWKLWSFSGQAIVAQHTYSFSPWMGYAIE